MAAPFYYCTMGWHHMLGHMPESNVGRCPGIADGMKCSCYCHIGQVFPQSQIPATPAPQAVQYIAPPIPPPPTFGIKITVKEIVRD